MCKINALSTTRSKVVKETIISYVIFCVIGLLVLNAWMYWQQTQMIFYPMQGIHQTPADWGLEYEDVTLKAEDGPE